MGYAGYCHKQDGPGRSAPMCCSCCRVWDSGVSGSTAQSCANARQRSDGQAAVSCRMRHVLISSHNVDEKTYSTVLRASEDTQMDKDWH